MHHDQTNFEAVKCTEEVTETWNGFSILFRLKFGYAFLNFMCTCCVFRSAKLDLYRIESCRLRNSFVLYRLKLKVICLQDILFMFPHVLHNLANLHESTPNIN